MVPWARPTTALTAVALALSSPLLLLAQDDCSMLDLFLHIDTVQESCCNAVTCRGALGMPGAVDPCTRECKGVYLPFWSACGDFVVNNNMDADQGMAEFRLTCLQPPPPPPGESCTPLAGEQADERVFDPCVCAGDTNGDFAVTSTDILNVLKAYGMTDCRLRVDFSGDCAVDVFDLLHVLHRMGNDCTTMSTCKSFVDMDHVYHANVGDGIYQLGTADSPGDSVYCDMTTSGGIGTGWTLWKNFGSADRWGIGTSISDSDGLAADGWTWSDDCNTVNDMGGREELSTSAYGSMEQDYLVVYSDTCESDSCDCAVTKTLPSAENWPGLDFSKIMIKAGSAAGEAYVQINDDRQPIAAPGIRMYNARPGDNFTIGEVGNNIPAIYWVFFR